jgi:hypothetical protein
VKKKKTKYMKHKINDGRLIYNELHQELSELLHLVNDLDPEKKIEIGQIEVRSKKLLYIVSKNLYDYIKCKEWEIQKIKRHEFYNSLILITPTVLAVIILILSVFNLNAPHKISIKEENLLHLNDSLKDENYKLKLRLKEIKFYLNK